MFTLFKKVPFALLINDNFVQALQLSETNDQPKIEAVGEIGLTPGIVKNGQILQRNVLLEALKKVLDESKPTPITQKECFLALAEAQSYEYVFYVDKNLQGESLKKALEEKISATVPFPLSELHYDFTASIFPTIQVVFTVLARKSVLEEYAEVMKTLLLKPLAIEPESLSLLRNLRCFDLSQKFILVAFKNNSLIWFLFYNGIIFDSNTVSLQDTSSLQKDLQQSLQYFQETTGQTVENIFIVGAESGMDGVPKALEGILPVKSCENYRLPFQDFDTTAIGITLPELKNGRFSTVAGAALRDFAHTENVSKMNLLKN